MSNLVLKLKASVDFQTFGERILCRYMFFCCISLARTALFIGMSSTTAFQFASLLKSWSHSLSDTEILEYIPQNFIGGDFTGNFAQVIKALADVLRKKIARYTQLHSIQNSFDGSSCIFQ